MMRPHSGASVSLTSRIAVINPPSCPLLFRPVLSGAFQPLAEFSQQRRAVTAPSCAMHTRQGGRLGGCEPLDHPGRVFSVRVVVHLVTESLARFEDVTLGDWRMLSARLA